MNTTHGSGEKEEKLRSLLKSFQASSEGLRSWLSEQNKDSLVDQHLEVERPSEQSQAVDEILHEAWGTTEFLLTESRSERNTKGDLKGYQLVGPSRQARVRYPPVILQRLKGTESAINYLNSTLDSNTDPTLLEGLKTLSEGCSALKAGLKQPLE